MLFGAVDVLWTRTGRVDQRTYPTSGPLVERVLQSDRASEFEAGRPRGRAMSRRAALRLAREYANAIAATALPDADADADGPRRTDAPEIGSPGHPST